MAVFLSTSKDILSLLELTWLSTSFLSSLTVMSDNLLLLLVAKVVAMVIKHTVKCMLHHDHVNT